MQLQRGNRLCSKNLREDTLDMMNELLSLSINWGYAKGSWLSLVHGVRELSRCNFGKQPRPLKAWFCWILQLPSIFIQGYGHMGKRVQAQGGAKIQLVVLRWVRVIEMSPRIISGFPFYGCAGREVFWRRQTIITVDDIKDKIKDALYETLSSPEQTRDYGPQIGDKVWEPVNYSRSQDKRWTGLIQKGSMRAPESAPFGTAKLSSIFRAMRRVISWIPTILEERGLG